MLPDYLPLEIIMPKMEYRIYIKSEPWNNQVSVYVRTDRDYLHFKDGMLTATKVENCNTITEPLLTLPPDLYKAIEARIMEEVEDRGGTPGTQYLRGKVEELEKMVEWLKSKV